MNLSDAISAVESASNDFTAMSAKTASDQSNVAVIQAKLDAANMAVATDITAQNGAAAAFNASLDMLIQVATAAKIPLT